MVAACLEHGVNYVDACWSGEVEVYAEALGDRREEIYFGFDWTLGRKPEIVGSVERIKQGLDDGLQKARLDYVDIWRITLREQCTLNTQQQTGADRRLADGPEGVWYQDLAVVGQILARLRRQVPALFGAEQKPAERERLARPVAQVRTALERLEQAVAAQP